MSKKILALALTALFVAPVSQAAVLDGDDAVVSSSSGRFKDWSLNFFSLATRPNMQEGQKEQGNRSIFAYSYLSMNYKVDSTQRYSLRVPFGYTSAGYNERGEDKSEEFQMQDVHFVYSNYDLGYIGDVDLSGKVKYYLPTSKSTLDKKTVGIVKFEGYADYVIARNWSIAYVFKPEFFIQTQTSYQNSFTGRASRTPQYELEHYLQLQWDAHSLVSLQLKSGFTEKWEHSSAAQNLDSRHYTQLVYGAAAWIRAQRGLMFTLVVQNETELVRYQGESINYGQPQNTEYLLLTNIAIL